MKKLLKYLSVLAIAGAFGLQTVSAADFCPAGEVEYTDYVLFLGLYDAPWLSGEIEKQTAGQYYTLWNASDYYNTIKNKATKYANGTIPITKGSLATDSGSGETWTVVDFWKKYYTAIQEDNRNANMVYKDGNTNYLTHEKWLACGSDFTNCVDKEHTTTAVAEALQSYLENGNRIDSLSASDELISVGTAVPKTTIEIPNDLDTATTETLRWKVSRKFTEADQLAGIPLAGANYIYTPAVAYVKYCLADTEGKVVALNYDKNTTAEVENMPESQSVTGKCLTIFGSGKNEPTREGYRFLGWSKNKGDTEADPEFAPGKEYCGAERTLYAVWEKNEDNGDGTYTVTYNPNGGKNEPSKQTGKVGECITLSSNKPTLSGNKFLGWSTDKNAKEPNPKYYVDGKGQSYCENANITLYAVWLPQTGISAHLIVFAGIAIAAGAAFVVAKKKDLFRQI